MYFLYYLVCMYINSGKRTIQVIYNNNLHKNLRLSLLIIAIIYNSFFSTISMTSQPSPCANLYTVMKRA